MFPDKFGGWEDEPAVQIGGFPCDLDFLNTSKADMFAHSPSTASMHAGAVLGCR